VVDGLGCARGRSTPRTGAERTPLPTFGNSLKRRARPQLLFSFLVIRDRSFAPMKANAETELTFLEEPGWRESRRSEGMLRTIPLTGRIGAS
jgi:hypothetical protein